MSVPAAALPNEWLRKYDNARHWLYSKKIIPTNLLVEHNQNSLNLVYSIEFRFWVFASQPTVHGGGASRGSVCGCGCWR